MVERELRMTAHAKLVICEQSIERDFAWASRFRRLVKDYERLPETVAGLHFVAFVCLFLQQAAGILSPGS